MSKSTEQAVGSIVLNLSDFAAHLDGREEERRLPLASSKAIEAVVGQSFLSINVRRGASPVILRRSDAG